MADERTTDETIIPFPSKEGGGTRAAETDTPAKAEVAAILTDFTTDVLAHRDKVTAFLYVAIVDGEPVVGYGGNIPVMLMTGVLETIKLELVLKGVIVNA